MQIINLFKSTYKMNQAIKTYGSYYRDNRYKLRKFLWYLTYKKEYKVALWGAGLKGNAFLGIIDPNIKYIDYVIDVNEDVHNSKVRTGHEINSYKQIMQRNINIVLCINTNFFTENQRIIKDEKINVILIDLDKFITSEESFNQILSKYSGDV